MEDAIVPYAFGFPAHDKVQLALNGLARFLPPKCSSNIVKIGIDPTPGELLLQKSPEIFCGNPTIDWPEIGANGSSDHRKSLMNSMIQAATLPVALVYRGFKTGFWHNDFDPQKLPLHIFK